MKAEFLFVVEYTLLIIATIAMYTMSLWVFIASKNTKYHASHRIYSSTSMPIHQSIYLVIPVNRS